MHIGPALIDGSPERRAGRRPEHADVSAAGAGTDRNSEIRLTLPANAENVALVRHVIAALGEALGLEGAAAGDMKLAVTEACTNVVRHAYEGTRGTLEVEVQRDDEYLVVIVTDQGRGLRPRPDSGGAGLGLPLMAALTHGLDIEHAPDCGARVRMSFRRSG
jgi:serine/threonine-protein kinase RsbW